MTTGHNNLLPFFVFLPYFYLFFFFLPFFFFFILSTSSSVILLHHSFAIPSCFFLFLHVSSFLQKKTKNQLRKSCNFSTKNNYFSNRSFSGASLFTPLSIPRLVHKKKSTRWPSRSHFVVLCALTAAPALRKSDRSSSMSVDARGGGGGRMRRRALPIGHA